MNECPTPNIDCYEVVQAIARDTLQAMETALRPGLCEIDIQFMCRTMMNARGVDRYWWYDVPALVLSGPRLRDSMEGPDYVPSLDPIKLDDMVTIDLAPEKQGYWGDCARSFFLRDGICVSPQVAGEEQDEGMQAQSRLHKRLVDIARPEMRFQELHAELDGLVQTLGFQNLDFLANFGHSIDRDVRERTFLDAQCRKRLDAVPFFTFEPHIAKPGSRLAFKHEEIYHFVDGQLHLL